MRQTRSRVFTELPARKKRRAKTKRIPVNLGGGGAGTAEQIRNGGFESGDFTGWKISQACTIETNPSCAHGGNFCGKISGADGSLSQRVTGLTPNTTYTLVGYVRLERAGEHAFVGVRDHGGEPVTRVTTATNFAKVALKFVTGPKSTTATIFFSKDNGTDVAWGDDFSVIEGLNDIDVIDSWLFTQACWNARDRRLLEVLQPDVLHRAGFLWAGTEMLERNYAGALQSLMKLRDAGSRNSRLLGAGTAGIWWEPDIEMLGPGVDREKATETPWLRNKNVDHLAGRGYLTRDAENQLLYKAKQQIDAGFFNIEFDELCPSEYLVTSLHDYAREKYGRKVFVTANPINLACGQVDYDMVRFYAFKDERENFNGRINPALPENNCWLPGEKDLTHFWFVDFPGINWMAANPAQYPNAVRLLCAWTLAAGNHRPSWSRTFHNRSDPLLPGNRNSGVFNIDANMIKFLKENGVLWHNLRPLAPPTLTVANGGKVWTSAFTQPMRTIVHLVNGNYDNQKQHMPKRNGLRLRISLNTPPTAIWMTTPDKLATRRKQPLTHRFERGIATVEIPELYFHDMIVIEQGPPNTRYSPIYEPMRVVFPFPLRRKLPAANSVHITAIQTEGFASDYRWSVNGIRGGKADVGTITGEGDYTAPANPHKCRRVTITTASKDDPAVSNSLTLAISPPLALPWRESFASEKSGAPPRDWEIVDGQGDWEVVRDGRGKVLHNVNLMDGILAYISENDFGHACGTNAMVVAGDQMWSDYTYALDVKPVRKPAWQYSDASKHRYGVFLVFRYVNHHNYYWYQLCTDGKARLYRSLDGHKTRINTPVPCNFPAIGKYTRAEVIVDRETFTLKVNGGTIRTDDDRSFPAGGIGVATSLTENFFRNIMVSPLGGREKKL